MSFAEVKKIIEKAQTDESFKKELLDAPDKAIGDYDLSDSEKEKFKGIQEKHILAFNGKIDQRYSKDGSAGADDDFWVESVSD